MDPTQDDRRSIGKTHAALARYAEGMVRPPSALRLVRELVRAADGTGIDTSLGILFNHSVWARDRVIAALDLLPERPEVARQVITTLAELQGTRWRRLSEEEPGRIHDERRDLRRWRAPLLTKALFGVVIAPLWGGSPRGYTSYFASDTTPLFILLVEAYAKLRPEILDARVTRGDGAVVTVADAVRRAARWLESHLDAEGFVEVPKHNWFSLPAQTWRDSPTSNFDECGRMPNVVEPMVYLDVQALAADALEATASLVRHNLRLPHDHDIAGEDARDLAWAEQLGNEARALRVAARATFWMEDADYFAFSADRDAAGHMRVLRATQSSAGWLLATRFFDDLPTEERARYVGGVARRVFAPDMLTRAGVRARALGDHAPRYRNYHEDVWPVDTHMVAKGLRRQGFEELASELEARLVNTANAFGGAWEFILVDDHGRLVAPRLDRRTARRLSTDARPLPTEMIPEANIGWTATALLRIKRDRAARRREKVALGAGLAEREAWIDQVTTEILARTAHVKPHRSRTDAARDIADLSSQYPDHARGLLFAIADVVAQGLPLLSRGVIHWSRRRPPR